MGVAGAQVSANTVLVTGLAGLLAGAGSMAMGEWVSVQSARELAAHQLEIEATEIEEIPDEEREELALIYEAKGLGTEDARALAARQIADTSTALDTLAREELGIDPDELGGSAAVAGRDRRRRGRSHLRGRAPYRRRRRRLAQHGRT
jgi:vacuolar iron transporter family protein